MKYSLLRKSSSGNDSGCLIAGILLLFLCMFFPFALAAADKLIDKTSSSGLDYQVGRWRGFKKAAFTITFDDNYRFQVVYATPLLNQHNYKATYFIVTNRVGKGWAPGWDTLNMLASEGHEIASHSKNHADFLVLSQHPAWADSMIHEFRDSRDTINARIPSKKCETFAWPNGALDTAAIVVGSNYYMACRGTENEANPPDPVNFYNIYSQHIYHDTQLAEINGYIENVLGNGDWLVEHWHGFQVGNDTNGYEPVPIQVFSDHFDYVAQKQDSLWITTLDTVVKYIRERDSSVLEFFDSTAYLLRFSLTNGLPDTLFHYSIPLSLKVREFGNMSKVYRISQGSITLPFMVTFEKGGYYLNFDALPNDSLIVMHLPDPAGIHDLIALNKGALNYPNPFSSSSTLLFDLAVPENTDIRIFDKVGRVVKNYSKLYPGGRNSVEVKGEGFAPGIYNCVISTIEGTMNVRMVILR